MSKEATDIPTVPRGRADRGSHQVWGLVLGPVESPDAFGETTLRYATHVSTARITPHLPGQSYGASTLQSRPPRSLSA